LKALDHRTLAITRAGRGLRDPSPSAETCSSGRELKLPEVLVVQVLVPVRKVPDRPAVGR
jgi:hypothetical protein